MTRKSALESVAGHLGTRTAANAVATFGATVTPLAAFVPFLVDSLASRRQAERLERMLGELNELVAAHHHAVAAMTDEQYKLVSEAIAAAFYTIDERKLQHLSTVAKNALLSPDIATTVVDSIARLIRDISAAEVEFLVQKFQYSELSLWGEDRPPSDSDPGHLIQPNTADEVCMSGLINLGLLYPKTSRWDMIAYEWSPLAAKLIALLNDTSPHTQPDLHDDHG